MRSLLWTETPSLDRNKYRLSILNLHTLLFGYLKIKQEHRLSDQMGDRQKGDLQENSPSLGLHHL